MRLRSLSLCNFRNLAAVEVEPHPAFTVVAGENGQGKTNLLEAIYYLLCLRPLRPARLRDLIRVGETASSIAARIERAGVTEELRARLDGEGRQLTQNGKPVVDLQCYLEGGAVVAFNPEDLAIVRAAPERRRRYLDRAVFTRWPAYLAESRDYGRLLRSRNRLLQERAPAPLRESFEGPLVNAGARLVARRRAWLLEIGPALEEAFRRIGRTAKDVTVQYQGAPPGNEAEIASWLRERLQERLALDLDRGFSSAGPHVDDLRFTLAGLDARRFASQGQARALIISLKVAEVENLRGRFGAPPLLLLDDVSSELDPARNRSLLDHLGDISAQVILTTTDPAPLLSRISGRAALWRVREGAVDPLGALEYEG